MKRLILALLAIAMTLTACNGASDEKIEDIKNAMTSDDGLTEAGITLPNKYKEYSTIIMDIIEMHDNVDYDFNIGDTMEDILNLKKSFDVNSYFNFFTHIKVKDGYIFDYIFDTYSDGGPILYFLPAEEYEPDLKSYYSIDEVGYAKLETRPQGIVRLDNDFIHFIEIDGTEEGYLEFMIFSTLAGQFALKWHANYFDYTPVISDEMLDYVLENMWDYNLKDTEKSDALELDTHPKIIMNDEKVTASIMYFSKWEGFVIRSLTFDTSKNNVIIEGQEETILKYHCGITY